MSSGGSDVNSATGATGNPPTTAKIESPIPKGPNAPEAPGGKGGFPAAQNPYGQQQSQVYMPPSQPTFYDQALGSPYSQSQYSQPAFQYAQPAPQYYQPQPQYYQPAPQYYQPAPQINSYGLAGLSGGSYNAYARPRPYSPPSPFNGSRMSPIEARPPMDEMQMGVMGGGVTNNLNNPAYQQQLAASNMTDYQRLMQRQQAASQPQPNYGAGLGGLEQNFKPSAPTDLEIANSLGYKGAGSAEFMTDMRARMPHEYEAENAANNAKAKEYLNSIGYGQAGFDASKYEVKRQPVSTGPRTGLGALLGGV